MEAMITNTHVYRSLQFFWRRKSYRRIIEDPRKSNEKRKTTSTKYSSWKLGSVKKKVLLMRIKVKIPTPKRLLVKLISSMHIILAGTVPSTTTKKKKKINDDKPKTSKRIRNKKEGEISEFEKQMTLHIYNNFVMANPSELKRPTS